MDKEKTTDGLLSGILAAALFLFFYIFIDIGALFSLLIAAGGFGAGALLFSRDNPKKIETTNDLKAALAEGTKKLLDIKKFEKLIKKTSVVNVVKEIEDLVARILDDIQKDPENDLKPARQFLTYYLDSTVTILNKYVELSAQDGDHENVRAALSRVETMLVTIRDAFEKQLGKLLTNDVMDLDMELSLLEQTINAEGLGK